MHGASVGRMLGCRKVYLPRLSGAFCALGMLHSDVRHDLVRVMPAPLDDADPDMVERRFSEMEADALAVLSVDGFAPEATAFARALDLRYRGQQWDVRVPLEGRLHADRVRKAFEAEHERLFGHHQPGGYIEITKLRLAAIGRLPALHPASPAQATGAAAPIEHRRAWIDPSHGWSEVPVWRGSELQPGHRLEGPLIIEEETTTLLIGAADTVEVDSAGNYVVHLTEAETEQ